MRCYHCNDEMMCGLIYNYHYLESGLDNVYIDQIEAFTCASCDEEFVRLPFVSRINTHIGRILIRKANLLSGGEVKFLRKNLGLKARELADMMGVDQATISRWESGKQNLSPSNDRFIRLLYAAMRQFDKDVIDDLIKIRFKDINDSKKPEVVRVFVSDLGYIPQYDCQDACLCEA